MIYYIFPYIVVYLYALFVHFSKGASFSFNKLLVVLLPAMLVAMLRGNIGVDTAFYSRFFQGKINNDLDSKTFEFGFEFLIDLLALLNFNITAIFAFIAFLISVLLSISFSRNRSSVLLFLLVYFPLFYVDSTMNALRYGLSFALASIAVDNLNRDKIYIFSIFSLFAVAIQISSFIVILIFIFSRFNWKIIVLFTLILVFFLSEVTEFILPYLISKKDAYSFSFSPSPLSGILPLTSFLLLYLSYTLFTNTSFTSPLLIVLLLFELASFFLAKYTYAGLRFQSLFIFCLILEIKNNINVKYSTTFDRTLFVLSLFLFGLFIRTIVTSAKDLDSGYLPYEFFWS